MAEVVTGEAVVLEVPCARFPSRLLAIAIDLTAQLFLLAVMAMIIGSAASGGALDDASGGAVAITALVLVIVGYPVIWETLSRGRSPGKLAMGLRVVSDDGGPERFRQALVRGLASVVEIWLPPFFAAPALICSLLSARGKRLGDVFAGTFVIQQRLPARRVPAAPPAVPPHLASWASGLELSGLTSQLAETARQYLARLPELAPGARAGLGQRIAAEVAARISPPPPPGTPDPAYLSAVLAERRRREQARLAPAGSPRPAGSYGVVPDATAWEGQQARPPRPAEASGQPAESPGEDDSRAPEGPGGPAARGSAARGGGFAPPA